MKAVFAVLVLCFAACNAAFSSGLTMTPSNFLSFFDPLTTTMTCDAQANIWDDTTRTLPNLISSSSARVLRAYYEPSTNQVLAPRLKSKDAFIRPGTLIVIDVNHIPDGSFAWPALWTVKGTPCSANGWPGTGEFDIIESFMVNGDMQNKPNMHSGANCDQTYVPFTYDPSGNYPPWTYRPNGYSSSTISCQSGSGTSNLGCVWNGRPQWTNTAAVNSAGGAVYAFWWKLSDASANFYFWRRSDVPSNINNPNPSTWGTPFASWSSSSCSQMSSWTSSAQNDGHNLIIDIKICGNVFGSSCVAPTTSSAYNDQYWAFNGIKTYNEY